MVGLMQKLLFDLLESTAGADAVVEVRRRAGVPEDKEFRIDEDYGDEEWRRLLVWPWGRRIQWSGRDCHRRQ